MTTTQAVNAQPTKVVIPCRVSYVHVWEKSAFPGSTPKYSLVLLIKKTAADVLKTVQAAILAAYNDGIKNGNFTAQSRNLFNPLKDGDVEKPGDEAYKGMMYINAKSDNPPQVFDEAKTPMAIKTNFYSGCYALVSVNFYPMSEKSPTKGVAAGLQNIMKTADGPALGGGRSTAEEDFAHVQPIAGSQPANLSGFGATPAPGGFGFGATAPANGKDDLPF